MEENIDAAKDSTSILRNALLESKMKEKLNSTESVIKAKNDHEGFDLFQKTGDSSPNCKMKTEKSDDDVMYHSVEIKEEREQPDVFVGVQNVWISESGLNKQEVTGEGPDQVPPGCNSKSDLSEHLLLRMIDEPHTCEICGYKTVRKENFQRHMEAHADKKPFVCEICSYRTLKKSDLHKHLRIHIGVKPFMCNLCDYKTVRKDSLKLKQKSSPISNAIQKNYIIQSTLRMNVYPSNCSSTPTRQSMHQKELFTTKFVYLSDYIHVKFVV